MGTAYFSGTRHLHLETCQCPSMTRCYHIIAVRMFVSLPVDPDIRQVSLRTLSKRSLKRSDKMLGRTNDVDTVILPATDSVLKKDTESIQRHQNKKKEMNLTCSHQ